jgi:hypothetical protein
LIFLAGVFEIETLYQHWGPPFEKKKESKEFRAEEGQGFDIVNEKQPEKLFTLIRLSPDKAIVEYNRLYTRKGYEQPHDRQVVLEIGKSCSFSFLWGEHGISKTLIYKGLGASEKIKEAAENKA